MVQGLQIDDSELREYTHGMLGSIAEKLGKDFAPFLPHAVEAAFASCSQVALCCLLLWKSAIVRLDIGAVVSRSFAGPWGLLGSHHKWFRACVSGVTLILLPTDSKGVVPSGIPSRPRRSRQAETWKDEQTATWADALQEDGTAGGDSEEEGLAEAKSESLGSDIDSEEEEEEEAASRRLNVRTGEPHAAQLQSVG